MIFHLPEDDGSCACKADDAMLAWHSLAWQLDPDTARAAQKADGIRHEEGGEEFLSDELDIAAALASAWKRKGAQVKAELLSSVSRGYSPHQFQAEIDKVAVDMDQLFEDVQPRVARSIRNVLGVGAQQAEGSMSQLLTSPNTLVTEEALLQATRYYTNRYFRQTIIPAIHSSIDKVVEGMEAVQLADIQAAIALHFRQVPYWNIVANVAASRGYHYGLLKTYQQQRTIGYRINAVIDDRTSKICIAMNGKEFLVSDAVQLLEGLANDPSPDAAKTRTPWLKLREIEGKTNDELARSGFLMPPFHALCRTTVGRIYA